MNNLELEIRMRELEKQIEAARDELDLMIEKHHGKLFENQEHYQKSLELDQLIADYVELKELSTSHHKATPK